MASMAAITTHVLCAFIGIIGGIYCLEQGQTLAAWAAMGFAALNVAELGTIIWRKLSE